jgi:hypothetical protein
MTSIHRRWSRVATAVLGVGALFVLSGCGGTTTVSGKVTHDGKPVVWGGVTLVDSSGTYHSGTIGLDGTYKIDNVPTGPVKVGVTSPKPPDDKPGKGGKGRAAAGGGNPDDPREKFLREQGITPNEPLPPPPPGAWFPLPEKAADPMTSGVSGTVAAGQPLDIDVPK